MTAMPKQIGLVEMIRRRQDTKDKEAHYKAFDAAKAQGACFDCASRIGFAATNKPRTTPVLCAKCVRRGVDPTP